MNKKIFLTSAVVFGLCCPAFAEEFPQDGLMQENTTYDNAATETNLGATSGTVNATANYENIQYQCAKGTYFNSTTLTCDTCLANYYCPAGTYTIESTSNGLNACPSTHPLSDAGAVAVGTLNAIQVCYRECTMSDISDTHATAVGGRVYNQNGPTVPSTCGASECEAGFYVVAAGDFLEYYGVNPVSYRYKSINGTGQNSTDTTGLNNGEWDGTWSDGTTVTGTALCSSTSGTSNTVGNPDTTSSSGYHCWCRMDNYQVAGESAVNAASPSWVYVQDEHYASGCASNCAKDCAVEFQRSSSFRSRILGDYIAIAHCVGNTISINWSDASAADIAANNAGQCTFGGDIRTPAAAETKPGKRFLGWTFQKAN